MLFETKVDIPVLENEPVIPEGAEHDVVVNGTDESPIATKVVPMVQTAICDAPKQSATLVIEKNGAEGKYEDEVNLVTVAGELELTGGE